MTRPVAVLTLLSLAGVARAQSAATDRALERYLERLGQRTLLIEQLDARLARTPGAERAALAERLTKLLAQELEAATTPARRADLERRARTLLDVIPEADSIDLRLSLHRATYANAEDIAERWRLRLASPEEVEEAKRVFPQLAAELARLGSAANRRVENLERLEEAARASMDEDEIAAQLADSRRQRSMAMYLSAWCLTYQAELEDQRAPALDAIPRFGWLLNAPAGEAPDIARVPEHTLAYEHVARAALGVATALGVAGDDKLAEQWIDLVVETKGVEPSVVAQAGKRRITLLARAARWTELMMLVRSTRGETPDRQGQPAAPLDPATARLLAVLAFERPAGRESPARQEIRRVAFADLIARNEVAQVVDLASRYGTESLGADGFITDYVRGLQAYRDATARQIAAGEADIPTADASIREQLRLAARLLDAALAASDAGATPAARADAAMLLAASSYLASAGDAKGMLDAAQRASQAIDAAVDDARRADALWLRIRALRAARDALESSGKDAALLAQVGSAAADAAAQFTQRFASDPRAGALVLERAAHSPEATADDATVDALLAIAPGAPSYDAARRRAAAMLFDAATSSPSDARRRDALRFAEVAGPLLDADAQRALAGDASRVDEATLLARQVLATLLADDVAESGLAQRAADRLSSLVGAGLVTDPAIVAELRYRELQIALFNDDAPRIDAALAALASIDKSASGRFLDAADRLAYRRAVNLWRAAPSDTARAGNVVRYGVRVLSTIGSGDDAASDGAALSTMMIVSDAAATLWRANRDADALQLARRLLRRAMIAQPNSADLLARSAALASDAGDHAEAAATWARLRAGAELGTEPWFRATTERIAALAKADRAAAQTELTRYFEVFPDGGPPPWGERLQRLRVELQGGAP